jgi:hypothetical protein
MKHIIPLELIELEESNYHLTVKSVFKENGEGLWVIDTGASKTVFNRSLSGHFEPLPVDDKTIVQSAGIGSEDLDITLGILHPFYLGNYLIRPMKVALIDLSHINSLYYHATEREICGLIGSDFLLENRAVIDYSKLQLILNKRAGNK